MFATSLGLTGIYGHRSMLMDKHFVTRIDVYETLCPQQMLVHKGGKMKDWGGECRDVTPTKLQSQNIFSWGGGGGGGVGGGGVSGWGGQVGGSGWM